VVDLLARVVAIGLVAALVPVPILIVLVLLAAPGGLARAWWFVFGFAGSLLVAGAAALLVAHESGVSFDPRALSAVGLVIGVAFLLMAARLAMRQRSQSGVLEAKALTLGGLSSGRVAALGVVAGALNPKTLPIFLTGVAAIAVAGESAAGQSLALALLTGTASVGVAIPPLLLTAPGQRTAGALERVRRAAEPYAATVAIALLALVGLAYVVFGLAGLR
jgi:threonine/homoserine/homoserine lactone efflux protein